jgi:hypothetical protein
MKTATLLCVLALACACSSWKKAVLTVDDVAAQLLCAQANAQKMGVSVEDAVELYCKSRPTWEPWLDAVLAARQLGAARAEGAPLATPGCPPGSVSTPTPAQPPAAPSNAPAGDAGAP